MGQIGQMQPLSDSQEEHSEELSDNSRWKSILQNIDKNKDGEVTVQEFCSAFDDFITIIHQPTQTKKESQAAEADGPDVIEDDMSQFIMNGYGSDEEIPELRGLISPKEQEKGLKFSKNGIIKYINDYVDQETRHNKNDPKLASLWEEKIKTGNCLFQVKKSEANNSNLLMRCEATFPRSFKMNKLVKALQDPKEKVKWNTNIQEISHSPIIPGVPNFEFVYLKNKQILQYSKRDFWNKSFNVFHDGVYYQMASSIYQDDGNGNLVMSTEKESGNDTVRGDIVISISKMWRNEKDGKIKFTFLTQPDFKMNVPRMIGEPLLVKGTKKWYDDGVKFYQKNHKKL